MSNVPWSTKSLKGSLDDADQFLIINSLTSLNNRVLASTIFTSAQTPWLTTINADTNNLTNLQNLTITPTDNAIADTDYGLRVDLSEDKMILQVGNAISEFSLKFFTSDDVYTFTQTTFTAPTIITDQIGIRDSDDTNTYTIKGDDLAADFDVTIPTITANDTFALLNTTNTFTANQTMNGTLTFTNQSTGGDPTLSSNSVNQDLFLDGRLGIGITDPRQNLHVLVSGSSLWEAADRGILVTDSTGPRIILEDSGEALDKKTFFMRNRDQVFSFDAVNDAGSSFITPNIIAMTRDGLVGIGTNAPNALLQIGDGTVVGADVLRFGIDRAWSFSSSSVSGGGNALELRPLITGAKNFRIITQDKLSTVVEFRSSNIESEQHITMLPEGTGIVTIGTDVGTKKLSVSDVDSNIVSATNTGASSPTTGGGGYFAYSDDGNPMASGDRLGFYMMGGATDTSNTIDNSCGIFGFASELWSASAMGSELAFEVTANTTIGRVEVMRIDNDGNVGIGTNTPTSTLDVIFPDDIETDGLTIQNTDGGFTFGNTTATPASFAAKMAITTLGNGNGFTTDVSITPGDTGTIPISVLNLRQSDDTDVENRPLWQIQNNGTPVLTVDADGTFNSTLANGTIFVGDENNTSASIPTGLETKEDCVAATTGDITLANSQTIDGVAVVNPNRVLVKNQTDAFENGIYVVVDAGAWTRATDADTDSEVNNGMFTLVTSGTINANTSWVLSTPDPIVVDTTNLTFDEFSFTDITHLNSTNTFTEINIFEKSVGMVNTNDTLILDLFSFNNSVEGEVLIRATRSRGTDVSPTAILDGDVIYEHAIRGYNGTSFVDCGNFNYTAVGNFTGTNKGTEFQISTQPINDIGDPLTRLLIDASGNVGIGTSDPKNNLHLLMSGTTEWSVTARGFLMTDDVGPRIMMEDAGEANNKKTFLFQNANQVFSFNTVVDSGASFLKQNILAMTTDGNVGIGTGTPNSGLDIQNSFALRRTATAISISTDNDIIIGVTTTPVTITLSTTDTVVGRTIIVKDESGTAGSSNITIDTEGSENIDGSATGISIVANFGSVRLYSDGSNWFTW